jgi:hypothetical protein
MHAKLRSVSYMGTAYKERITNSSRTASSTCCMEEIVLVSFRPFFHLRTCCAGLILAVELNILVSELTPQEKATPEVRHAIAVHMAMATGNYHKFFVLYAKAPNMGGYIMDHYADRERCAALITMGRAYVFDLPQNLFHGCLTQTPFRYKTLPVNYLLNELGYEDNELPRLIKFLTEHSASIFTNPNAPEREFIVDLKSALPGVLQAQAAKYTKVGIKGQV